MTVLYLIFVSTLVNMFKDSAGTVCSDAVTDGTTVLNMCEDGTAVGDHVVIDTYGSSVYRKDGGSINCSCTATVTGLPDGTVTTVGYGPVQSLYPPYPCGSSVFVLTQLVAFLVVSTNEYLCTNNTYNIVQTNDTVTVVWHSGVSGSTSGYCLSLRAGLGSSLSTKCFTMSSQRETTTQLRETTAQARETTTTTKLSTTTTDSRETITYKSTNSGSTTLGQMRIQQNNLHQCYPLIAVVVPLAVAVHLIIYRKRLALNDKPENTGAVMTSPNSVHYDSLDLSRVEPPNVYAVTST